MNALKRFNYKVEDLSKVLAQSFNIMIVIEEGERFEDTSTCLREIYQESEMVLQQTFKNQY